MLDALTPIVCAEGATDREILSSMPPADGAPWLCGAKQMGDSNASR
jgi:hypothetical protein